MKERITRIFIVLFISVSGFSTSFASSGEQPENEKTIKVLAIGNSFSQDAVETYLHELAAAAGVKMIVGNLYIGGAPLVLHVENIRGDKPKYSYRKIGVDGKKVTTPETKISEALVDEDWDFISLQQVSGFSGIYSSYEESLPELYQYVLEHVNNPKDVKMVLHQTWAYQGDSDHKNFSKYHKNQETMYAAISETSEKVMKLVDFDRVIPAGTAIQNGRSSFIGDHFTRDGYHLEENYGRFTAACTWFEALLGMDVRKNTYVPPSVKKIEAEIAKEAAHQAVLQPYQSVSLEKYTPVSAEIF